MNETEIWKSTPRKILILVDKLNELENPDAAKKKKKAFIDEIM